MATEAYIEASALNIDASDHPDGIYVQLLTRASRKIVQARGSDYLKLTRPKKVAGSEIYVGRILVWTDIDLTGRWLDIETEDDLSDETKNEISIPGRARPNYRSFDYVFNAKKHRLYFESKNILDQTLGPTTARRSVYRLLSPEVLGTDVPTVEVTILPEEDALDRVLRLPGLRSLFIRVMRPNADVSSPAARQRVEQRLAAAKAQKLEETWYKSSEAESLQPTPEIIEIASVAADVGLVSGVGRDKDGRRMELATNKYPRRIPLGESLGDTLLAKLQAALHTFF